MLVQVLSEASLVPHNEMQSETASDDYGTSQRRLASVVELRIAKFHCCWF